MNRLAQAILTRYLKRSLPVKMKTFMTSMFADRKDSATWAMIGSIVLQFACKSAPAICDVVQSLSQNVLGMDSANALGCMMLYGVLRATSKSIKAEPPAAPKE